VSAQADTVALSPRPGRRLRLASPAIGGALATAYLSLVVLLPLAAVVAESTTGGPSAFWQSVTSAQAFAAMRFTVLVSLVVVVVNIVTGTLIAWVLVRDEFPGKRFVNALIDLPFALPTMVAGLVLLALYGPNGPAPFDIGFTRIAVALALLFVTLPFVVRSVQPVLMEADREMEEAALSLGARPRTVFARIVLPNLVPAIAAGAGLAFARALGEFGSVVLISGNIPFKTEVASVFLFGQVESDNTAGAAAVSVVLGPSGGGKSTLLRVIAGLEAPDSGEVLFSGEAVTKLPAQERGVGFVFQHYAAFKHMTVRDNIAFGLKIRKRPKAEVRARVDELLALVHLGGWADRYPAQLSGGQRQRMALARALAVQPRVLLLDEPFGALDATVRKELRDWLRRLHDEVHVTTIFVTHDQEEALEVAQQVAVINAGRIEQTGTPDDLYERPANAFVMGFVGPVSRLGETWVRPHDIEVLQDHEDGAIEAMIERVARVGFEVRVEAVLGDGTPLPILATRDEAEELELRAGQLVWLRVHRTLEFAA